MSQTTVGGSPAGGRVRSSGGTRLMFISGILGMRAVGDLRISRPSWLPASPCSWRADLWGEYGMRFRWKPDVGDAVPGSEAHEALTSIGADPFVRQVESDLKALGSVPVKDHPEPSLSSPTASEMWRCWLAKGIPTLRWRQSSTSAGRRSSTTCATSTASWASANGMDSEASRSRTGA
jgi:hypothetical protein